MRTLIVDDEPIARRVLREGLETFPDIEIVGEAADGNQALQKIKDFQPDLVFLDLQMPAMNGFEVVRNLRGTRMPIIVIATAFDQNAIEAFEVGAVDYLLKPISEARLQRTLERVRELQDRPVERANAIAKITAAEEQPPKNVLARKILGRVGAAHVLLEPDEILAFQADGELVWIVGTRQKLLATQTLRALEERLEPQFKRVHRNAIVNVNHVRTITTLSSQRWQVTLSNSLQIIVSKRQARNIRRILNW